MIRGLLLDLEGVLYEGPIPVAGAAEALAALRAGGLSVRYLTNTTTQPRRVIAERLRAMGFAVEDPEVFTPPAAAARLLKGLDAQLLHLAAAPALAEDFADFTLVGEDTPCDAIVLGDLYLDFTWQRLNSLFQLLAEDVPLIALHKNRICKREEGISLDLGPFVAALEYATGSQAAVTGKPAQPFFALALESLALPPREVLMVGDDIEADIGGALAAGLAAVQVKTGKYRPQDANHPKVTPTGRIDSIVALQAWLENQGDGPA